MSPQQKPSLFRSRQCRAAPEHGRGRSFSMMALGVMAILSICACTSRSMYEERRQDARRKCLDTPSGVERDKCLERNSQSYDDYTRERKRVQREEEDK